MTAAIISARAANRASGIGAVAGAGGDEPPVRAHGHVSNREASAPAVPAGGHTLHYKAMPALRYQVWSSSPTAGDPRLASPEERLLPGGSRRASDARGPRSRPADRTGRSPLLAPRQQRPGGSRDDASRGFSSVTRPPGGTPPRSPRVPCMNCGICGYYPRPRPGDRDAVSFGNSCNLRGPSLGTSSRREDRPVAPGPPSRVARPGSTAFVDGVARRHRGGRGRISGAMRPPAAAGQPGAGPAAFAAREIPRSVDRGCGRSQHVTRSLRRGRSCLGIAAGLRWSASDGAESDLRGGQLLAQHKRATLFVKISTL